jgi:hypothetical protein
LETEIGQTVRKVTVSMRYIYGQDWNQIQLYTGTLDELLGEDNLVRVIDAFVNQLNITELRIKHADPARPGLKPSHLSGDRNIL